MQLPKLIIGAVTIFWGWQTGLWFIALPIALIYELSFFVSWRWRFTTAHFRYCSNFCTLLLVGVIIYLWNLDVSLKLIFFLFQWLPFIFSPLLIAQAYSDSEGIDIRALLFLKEKPSQQQQKATLLSVHYPFLAICLIAASAGNTRDVIFYLGIIGFSAVALWFVRSPRSSAIAWIVTILLASTIGFFGHLTLHHAHLSLEKRTGQWVRQFYTYHNSNPTQRTTAIGDIGTVKLSNKILLRVKPDASNLVPNLLRRVAYNNYINGMWVAVKSEFNDLDFQSETVSLLPETLTEPNINLKKSQDKITIYRSLEEGNNLLNLPNGTQQITKLPVEKVAQNQYGTVQVESEPVLASYQITYNSNFNNRNLPVAEDLAIPKQELPAIKKVIQELDLAKRSDREILNTVLNFFNTEFTYSLRLARQGFYPTPLSAFFLEHRSGHCEYFATATALLLRELGIPTRYAIGYSVHEYSSLEKQYIVRGKNAHAWNLVYIDGAWEQFDTTPSNWIDIENNATSKLVIIRDILSLIVFKLLQLSALIGNLSKTLYFWLLVIPFLLILLWWLLRNRQLNEMQLQRVVNTDRDFVLIGADSEIYAIEQALKEAGLVRSKVESWQQWAIGLQTDKQLTDSLITTLNEIVKLHYRYRFDPRNITREERIKLKLAVESWLIEYREFSQNSNEIKRQNFV